jgi:hypothetical protein
MPRNNETLSPPTQGIYTTMQQSTASLDIPILTLPFETISTVKSPAKSYFPPANLDLLRILAPQIINAPITGAIGSVKNAITEPAH